MSILGWSSGSATEGFNLHPCTQPRGPQCKDDNNLSPQHGSKDQVTLTLKATLGTMTRPLMGLLYTFHCVFMGSAIPGPGEVAFPCTGRRCDVSGCSFALGSALHSGPHPSGLCMWLRIFSRQAPWHVPPYTTWVSNISVAHLQLISGSVDQFIVIENRNSPYF